MMSITKSRLAVYGVITTAVFLGKLNMAQSQLVPGGAVSTFHSAAVKVHKDGDDYVVDSGWYYLDFIQLPPKDCSFVIDSASAGGTALNARNVLTLVVTDPGLPPLVMTGSGSWLINTYEVDSKEHESKSRDQYAKMLQNGGGMIVDDAVGCSWKFITDVEFKVGASIFLAKPGSEVLFLSNGIRLKRNKYETMITDKVVEFRCPFRNGNSCDS